MKDPAHNRPRNRFLPSLTVRAIGLWVLAGALFKLLAGTPADLPPIVREVPLDLALIYKLVIAIELCIVIGALLKPRLTWPVTLLLLLIFDGILVSQMLAGSSNCGCFGSDISMPPWVMLAIDSALLALLIYSRPWSGLKRPGAPLKLVLVLCLGAAVLPWLMDREAKAPRRERPLAVSTSPRPNASNEAETSNGMPAETAATATTPAPTETAKPEQDEAPAWAILSPEEWIGKSLMDTELYDWLPEGAVESTLPDSTWILYRQSCDHCAEHLEELALADDGSVFYVLVQVPDDLDQTQAVFVKPTGPHVVETRLAEGVDFVLTTPADMQVVEYEVVAAREEIPDDHH